MQHAKHCPLVTATVKMGNKYYLFSNIGNYFKGDHLQMIPSTYMSSKYLSWTA